MVRDSDKDGHYICINCGRSVNELYKKYSTSVIKIVNCKHCDDLADKYIEFEPIIVLLDLVLLSQPAYRHVLYNTDFPIHYKLGVITLLLESYILWNDYLKGTASQGYKDNLNQEERFYWCFVMVVIDNLILYILLWIFSLWPSIRHQMVPSLYGGKTLLLLKALTLSKIGKFFLLPAMIWKNNITELGLLFHIFLVMGYLIISLYQAYLAFINRTSRFYAGIIVIVSMTIQTIISRAMFKVMDDAF